MKMTTQKNPTILTIHLILFIACLASSPVVADNPDPWERINRAVYIFNDGLDRYILKPTATAYKSQIPLFAQKGVGNFFNNINDINVMANDLMQLKLSAALVDSGRLLINSTVGLGGLFEVANSLGLEKNNEDFGQTLGYWRVGSGPYIVLPLLGASTLRDSVGLLADSFFDPLRLLDDDSVSAGLRVLSVVNVRTSLIAAESLITGDKYLFVRDAYLQNRQYLISDGEVADEYEDY